MTDDEEYALFLLTQTKEELAQRWQEPHEVDDYDAPRDFVCQTAEPRRESSPQPRRLTKIPAESEAKRSKPRPPFARFGGGPVELRYEKLPDGSFRRRVPPAS